MDLNLRRPALRRLSLPAELPSTVRSWPKVSLRERCFVSPKSTIGLPRTQSSGRAAQSVLALETPAWLCFVSRRESGVLLSTMPLELERSTARRCAPLSDLAGKGAASQAVDPFFFLQRVSAFPRCRKKNGLIARHHRVPAFPGATGQVGLHARTLVRVCGRPFPLKPERKPQSPAIVISSMRIEPVRMPPRTSMSDPTSTIF